MPWKHFCSLEVERAQPELLKQTMSKARAQAKPDTSSRVGRTFLLQKPILKSSVYFVALPIFLLVAIKLLVSALEPDLRGWAFGHWGQHKAKTRPHLLRAQAFEPEQSIFPPLAMTIKRRRKEEKKKMKRVKKGRWRKNAFFSHWEWIM